MLGSGLTELQGETGLEALNLVVRGQLALHDGTCERQGLGQSGPTVALSELLYCVEQCPICHQMAMSIFFSHERRV